MPTYERFEDLPVWNLAVELATQVFPWTQQSHFRGQGDLANQLQRAALSVSNNIAEGFERGSTAELLQFLYIARGSAGEVRSMLCVMERLDRFSDLKSDISNFKLQAETVSRQIRGWANSLQNSEIKGQRHLNKTSRKAYESQQSAAELHEYLDNFRRQMDERLKREATERSKRGNQPEGK
ncbi:MAG: hypothetical protein Fues2KO_35210 [Fuerstiella sp.]